MTRSLSLISLLFTCNLWADTGWELDLSNSANTAKNITVQLSNPNLSPSSAADLQRQKQSAVKNIEAVGANTKTNPAAQLAVGRSLASVEESHLAIPYAENGLSLAEASGDKKLLREALLTGSMVYEKAGQYELARARAQRVLKDNPKDKDALALYMMVKDRVSATAISGGSAGRGGNAGATAGSTSNGGGAMATRPQMTQPPASPPITLTTPASRAAQRYSAEGRRMMKLDAKAALRSFDLAVAADPKGASARVERAKARLMLGDAAGALDDANTAATLDPLSADAYAARAEANRALGRTEADTIADYETAAKLDGRFSDTYKKLLAQMGGSQALTKNIANSDFNGSSAPDDSRGLPALPAKKRQLFGASAAVLCLAIAALLVKRRSS